jgi:hypothetical protein
MGKGLSMKTLRIFPPSRLTSTASRPGGPPSHCMNTMGASRIHSRSFRRVSPQLKAQSCSLGPSQSTTWRCSTSSPLVGLAVKILSLRMR